MIVCGWCGQPTDPSADQCGVCGHVDPAKPWLQRDQQPPVATEERAAGGRPQIDASQARERIRIATKELGGNPTKAELAEYLRIDVRTLGRWQKLAG